MIYKEARYKETKEFAAKYHKDLLATDPRFRLGVQIKHTDGSIFKWARAFYLEEDYFVMVFTEHHGFYVYYREDLISIELV